MFAHTQYIHIFTDAFRQAEWLFLSYVCLCVCIYCNWVLMQPFVPSWRSRRPPFALFTINLPQSHYLCLCVCIFPTNYFSKFQYANSLPLPIIPPHNFLKLFYLCGDDTCACRMFITANQYLIKIRPIRSLLRRRRSEYQEEALGITK